MAHYELNTDITDEGLAGVERALADLMNSIKDNENPHLAFVFAALECDEDGKPTDFEVITVGRDYYTADLAIKIAQDIERNAD